MGTSMQKDEHGAVLVCVLLRIQLLVVSVDQIDFWDELRCADVVAIPEESLRLSLFDQFLLEIGAHELRHFSDDPLVAGRPRHHVYGLDLYAVHQLLDAGCFLEIYVIYHEHLCGLCHLCFVSEYDV